MSKIHLYNEDCLEGMERIPDGSVDMILCDPPYCVGATSNGIKASIEDNSLIKPFFRELFSEWQRALKPGAYIYMFTDWRTYPILQPPFSKYFKQRNLLIWNKTPYMTSGCWYRFSYECIIFGTHGKGKRKFAANSRDILNISPSAEAANCNRVHQSQKPVNVLERLIEDGANEGDTVLDCFMGSGSTGVACVNTGRDFIGFELEPKYYEIARQRISDAQAKKGLELFKEVSG